MLAVCLLAIPGFSLAAPVPPKPSAKPVPATSPVPPSKTAYEARCSFCHALKPARSLPDMTAWIKLLYTSGCPQVGIKLDENQRRSIRAYLEAEFKQPPVTPPPSPTE